MRAEAERGGPRLPAAVGLAAALALSAFAYARIVQGSFFADDFLFLYRAANAPVLDLLLTPQGGHLYIARNAVYLLFRFCFGVDPRWYFGAVLCTHLANVALLFALLRRLVGSVALATFGAALWGALPCHAYTLDWFAVYGQACAATALLVILWSAARLGDRQPRRLLVGVWYALALIGATSFGVGFGMALALPLALPLIAPGTWPHGRRLPALGSLLIALPALYVTMQLYARWWGDAALRLPVAAGFFNVEVPTWITGASTGTESGFLSQVAGFCLQPAVLAMLARLALKGTEVTAAGLFGGSSATLGLGSSLAGLVFVGCTAYAWVKSGRIRHRVVGFALLAAAGYGIIALGRGRVVESFNDGWQLPPYYQYLASIPVVVIWCIGLAEIGRAVAIPAWTARSLLGLWWAAGMARLWVAPVPIDLHEAMGASVERGVHEIRARIAAAPPGSMVVLPPHRFNFNAAFFPVPALPGWIALFTIYFPDDTVDGRRVVFTVSDPELLAATAHGRRTATLVQPDRPGEAPAR